MRHHVLTRSLVVGLGAIPLLGSLAGCNLDFAERPLPADDGTPDTVADTGGGGDTGDVPDDSGTDTALDTTGDDTATADVDTVDTAQPADLADDTLPPGCVQPRVECDGLCVDPMTDPTNCGGCGVACDASTGCLDGTCQPLDACGWLEGVQYRRPITVAAPATEGVDAGYSVRLELDVGPLYLAGKIRSDGSDLRLATCHADGTLEVLDVVLDPTYTLSPTNLVAPFWFATQRGIAAASLDARYWLFYGDPQQTTPSPDDWGRVFMLGADLRSSAMPPATLAATFAGGGRLDPDPGGLRLVSNSPGSDAAIVYGAMALPADRRFAIRHHVEVLRTELGIDDPPLAGIEGLYLGSGDVPPAPIPLPDDFESAGREIRARLYDENDGQALYTLRYASSSGQQHSWSGSTWVADLANHQSFPDGGGPHLLELVSDGEQWHFAVRDTDGDLLDQTSAVSWSTVFGAASPSLWLAWGDPFIDAYGGELRSGYVWVRRYQDPEPTVTLGAEETRP